MDKNDIRKTRSNLYYTWEDNKEYKFKTLGWRWNKKIVLEEPADYNGSYRVVRVLDPKVKNSYGHKKVCVQLELSKEKDGWHVDMATVDRKYQGSGLGFKLYKFLLRNMEDFKLMAGRSQSAGATKLWNKLAKTHDIRITAKTSERGRKEFIVIPGDKECVGLGIDLYGEDISNTSVMIAEAV